MSNSDTNERWLGIIAVSLFCYFAFFRELLAMWLHKSFLRVGRVAEIEQRICSRLIKLKLVPPIVLPTLDTKMLLEGHLPGGFGVRAFRPEDKEACLEIYRANAPGRFPPEVESMFVNILEKDELSFLVIVNDDQVIACGGIYLTGNRADLCYGLVRPEFQKQGIGRLLLLSRLVRLESPAAISVHIYAVNGSIGYYQRFNFSRYMLWRSADGDAHPVAGVSLHPHHRAKIADYLQSEGYPILPSLVA